MAISRPSLDQLYNQIQAEVYRKFETNHFLEASYIAAINKAVAAFHHGMYHNLESMDKQVLPDTADLDGLKRWANLYGLKPHPSKTASIEVVFHGEAGAKIDPGVAIRRLSDSLLYQVTAVTTLQADGTGIANCVCMESGTIGNTSPGAQFEIINPVPRVDSRNITFRSSIELGLDPESKTQLLNRLLLKLRNPGRGGTLGNYISWCKEVPGVGRVWVFENETASHIDVMFLTTDPDNPIPTERQRTEVNEVLLLNRPMGCFVNVDILTPKNVNFSITLPPGFMREQERVKQDLKRYFLEQCSPKSTILLSDLVEVIIKSARTKNITMNAPTGNDIVVDYKTIALLGNFQCEART